jgi:hypothetical protein
VTVGLSRRARSMELVSYVLIKSVSLIACRSDVMFRQPWFASKRM